MKLWVLDRLATAIEIPSWRKCIIFAIEAARPTAIEPRQFDRNWDCRRCVRILCSEAKLVRKYDQNHQSHASSVKSPLFLPSYSHASRNTAGTGPFFSSFFLFNNFINVWRMVKSRQPWIRGCHSQLDRWKFEYEGHSPRICAVSNSAYGGCIFQNSARDYL